MPKIPQYQQQLTVNNLGNIPAAAMPQIAPVQGQAFQAAGNALTNLAQSRQDAINETNSLWVTHTMADFRLKNTTRLMELQNSYQGPGTGFTDDFLKGLQEEESKILQMAPDKKSKDSLTAYMDMYRTQIGVDAKRFELETFNKYTANQFIDTKEKMSQLTLIDPTQGLPSIYTFTKQIDQQNIPQELKYKLKKDGTEDIARAYVKHNQGVNPKGLLNEIYPYVGRLPSDDPYKRVFDESVNQNVNPLATMTIMGTESGARNIKNPTKGVTAKGFFQFNDKTWAEYGGTPENRDDPVMQVKLGVKYVSDRINELRTFLGREPTLTEIKIGHVFRNNAPKILSALQNNPDKSIDNIIGADTAKKNGIGGLTVQDAYGKFDRQVNSMAKKFGGNLQDVATNGSMILSFLPADELAKVAKDTMHLVQHQKAQESEQLKITVADHLAMAKRGVMPSTPLPEQAFSEYSNDPVKNNQEYKKYVYGLRTGIDVSNMILMDSNQRTQFAESSRPTSEADYKLRSEDYQQKLDAIKEIDQNLKDNAAGFLRERNPVLNQLHNTYINSQDIMTKTVALNKLLTAQLAEQNRQGVAVPQLIEKPDAERLVRDMANATGDKLATIINENSTTYGQFWPLVNRQLSQMTGYPKAAIVISNLPNPNAQKIVGDLANIKIEDLKVNAGGEKAVKPADLQVEKFMTNFVNSLSPNMYNEQTIDSFRDSVKKLTYVNMRQGMNAKDAASDAFKSILGHYNFENNDVTNYPMRIPAKYNSELVARGAEVTLKNFKAGELMLPEGVLKFRDPKETETNFLTKLRGGSSMQDGLFRDSQGVWVTNSDETGLNLFFRGRDNRLHPVMKKDGAQVSMSFDDLSQTGFNNKSLWMKTKEATINLSNTLDSIIPQPKENDSEAIKFIKRAATSPAPIITETGRAVYKAVRGND